MGDALSLLWAKKNVDEWGRPQWSPLLTHLKDTANVIEWLAGHWLADAQVRLMQGQLSDEDFGKLLRFLGASHDVGKATYVFQCKQSYQRDADIDEPINDRLDVFGLVRSDQPLPNARKSPHGLAGEALLYKAGLNESVAAIIGGHHGIPTSNIPVKQLDRYPENYWGSGVITKQQSWRLVQTELIEWICNESGYATVNDVPNVTQPQAVLLEGLLIMADWLASSEDLGDYEQTPLFPLISIDLRYDDVDSRLRFQTAMANWSLSGLWATQQCSADVYRDQFGFNPRPVQAKITKAIEQAADPRLMIIEAPMGIGKTEIALVAAEQLASKFGLRGVYFGLPTQATSNAIFSRLVDWLKHLATVDGQPLTTHLMHGKAGFNTEFANLPRASNVDTDADDGAVAVNSWFSGKKTILDDFDVGTIDQILLMGLKQKHLFLRHLGVSGKVVILDEVHSFDAYMDVYLDRALAWLGAYGVPVIMLSATLTQAKRQEFVLAYQQGKNPKLGEAGKDALLSGEWATTVAYPQLTMLDGDKACSIHDFPKAIDQNVKVVRSNVDDEGLMDSICESISGGGVAGLIVNTVKRAQQLAQLVPRGVKLLVLHSAFVAPRRSELEDELQQMIGKHGIRPKKLIVIGTQVLEQSLDIDFDILYTDLSPMDLLLQRIGRLHRHGIVRPKPLQSAKVVVMVNHSDDGSYGRANELIYSRYLLMRTDRMLPGVIKLPSDISRLVQAVYGDGISDTDAERSAHLDFDNHTLRAESKAKVFEVASPPKRLRQTIHGWLDQLNPGLDRNADKAIAAVRDSSVSIEVVLLKRSVDGVLRLTNGQCLSEVSSVVIAQATIKLPIGLSRPADKVIKQLEELTSKALPEWQQDQWLRGSLALILRDDYQTEFNGYDVQYDDLVGLQYSKPS